MEVTSVQWLKTYINRGQSKSDKEKIKTIIDEFAKSDGYPYLSPRERNELEIAFNKADNGDQIYTSEELIKAENYFKIFAILEKLENKDSQIRKTAALDLDKLNWQPTTKQDQILYFIAKQNWEELVKFGPMAIEALKELLTDENDSIRFAAAQTLKKLGWQPQNKIEAVYFFFAEKNWADLEKIIDYNFAIKAVKKEDDLLKLIEVNIREIDGQEICQNLFAALKELLKYEKERTTYGLDNDKEFQVAKKAIQAKLVEIGEPVVKTLIAFVLWDKDPQDTISFAVNILSKIESRQIIPALIKGLNNDNSVVRQRALTALKILNDETAVLPLTEILKNDSDIWCRSYAAEILGTLGDKRAVGPLLEALKDNNWQVKSSAVEALSIIEGKKAIPTLVELFKKEKHPEVTQKIVSALAGFYDQQLVPIFIEALQNSNQETVKAAKDGLRLIGKPAAQSLRGVLKNDRENTEVLKSAIILLGEIGDEAAVPVLIQFLNSWNSTLSEAAGDALVMIGTPAVSSLIDNLKISRFQTSNKAAKVLGEIGDEAAIPALAAVLKDKNFHGDYEVVEALGRIGQPAVPAIIEASKNDLVKNAAKRCLVEIGEPAIPILITALLNENVFARSLAASALEELNWTPQTEAEKIAYLIAKKEWPALVKIGSAAVPEIIGILKDDNPSMRRSAAKTLGQIGDPRAVDPLIKTLYDPYSDIRATAVTALAQIGDKRAVKPLKKLRRDENENVRQAVKDAIEKIEPKRNFFQKIF